MATLTQRFDPALLKAARQRTGISQAQLALRAGVSRSAMSMWEQGERTPELGNILALSDALGVSVAALIRTGVD